MRISQIQRTRLKHIQDMNSRGPLRDLGAGPGISVGGGPSLWQLNPAEQVCYDFKRHTGNSILCAKQDIRLDLHGSTRRVRSLPDRLCSFVRASDRFRNMVIDFPILTQRSTMVLAARAPPR